MEALDRFDVRSSAHLYHKHPDDQVIHGPGSEPDYGAYFYQKLGGTDENGCTVVDIYARVYNNTSGGPSEQKLFTYLEDLPSCDESPHHRQQLDGSISSRHCRGHARHGASQGGEAESRDDDHERRARCERAGEPLARALHEEAHRTDDTPKR